MKIEDLTFSYDKSRVILDSISFSAEPGEHIGLIGANGAGKTTLLKLIVGLLKDFCGEISVGDLVLSQQNIAEIRRRIGYIFQDSDSQLFMPTAFEDIMFGPRNYGYSEEEAVKSAEEAMRLTGSEYLKDRQIHKLSGGEKKLIAIASVLALKPEVIIMDEPTNSLDPGNRRRLINVLKSLECTELIATHDLDMVWETCSRVILLSGGRIAASGSVRDILTDEKLLASNGLELPLSAKIWKLETSESRTDHLQTGAAL